MTTGSDEAISGTIVRCPSNPNPENLPWLSACEPFREAIELGLSRRCNAAAIRHDLVSENGFCGGYQTVKRFVRKLCGAQTLVPRAVIVTEPGQEAQVEYGRSPMVAIHTAANIDAPACSC